MRLPCQVIINKTYHKILNHFYWPGLKSDVSQFYKSCHTSQMVGKPNQTIPEAQLQPIPAFDEPFSRIIIDCVGPLPKTKSVHEYLLTIMFTSTRFPEAIPPRNIKTKNIVKKGKRKVQGVPQSQTAALPRPQEEEETDKSKQAQTKQTYEKH